MTGPGSSPSTDTRQDDAGHGRCNWCGVRVLEPQDAPGDENRVLACSEKCGEALDRISYEPRVVLTEPLREARS